MTLHHSLLERVYEVDIILSQFILSYNKIHVQHQIEIVFNNEIFYDWCTKNLEAS